MPPVGKPGSREDGKGSGSGLTRRRFVGLCSAVGLIQPGFPGALWTASREIGAGEPQGTQGPGKITKEMILAAETMLGLEFTEAKRELMLGGVNSALDAYAALRKVSLPNSVLPAVRFDPVVPGAKSLAAQAKRSEPSRRPLARVAKPARRDELAFLTVAELGGLLKAKQVTALELTQLALERLKRFDPELLGVVNLTEERALQQARAADLELQQGKWRGPLHGIPWGAKDLLAVSGYPTTWGSPLYKDQLLPENATVVERLDAAGAILVAKLSLGEFAQGDVWYGGTTKNPWKTDQGSSGSSAGPASATAAGCVAFAIGSETLGSIVSPSTRCGTTGLRPTFGRVSRAGAMALSWTMDKLGPLCRSAVDCGLVLEAIAGPDGKDPTVTERPFGWTPGRGVGGLRIAYLKAAFDAEHATKAFDARALEVLKGIGVGLLPFELPADLPTGGLRVILSAEAAAAFDEVTRSGRDDQMVQQTRGGWPNSFRTSRFIPAVEYIQANRVRTLLMQRMDELMQSFDVLVVPGGGGSLLSITNNTGHPQLVLPNGFNAEGTPVSLSFIGRLYGEADLIAVAEAYQGATDFHRKHPAKFS
jgi:Asp-tRNA(Asn)/Glu-tRNA(Gln) amidotransferase A subunit family amidase